MVQDIVEMWLDTGGKYKQFVSGETAKRAWCRTSKGVDRKKKCTVKFAKNNCGYSNNSRITTISMPRAKSHPTVIHIMRLQV